MENLDPTYDKDESVPWISRSLKISLNSWTVTYFFKPILNVCMLNENTQLSQFDIKNETDVFSLV